MDILELVTMSTVAAFSCIPEGGHKSFKAGKQLAVMRISLLRPEAHFAISNHPRTGRATQERL